MNRRIGVLLVLGFASGLPLELTGGTLQLWFADQGVDLTALATSGLVPFAPGQATLPGMDQVTGIDLTTIALLNLIGIAYLLKVLWAPALDRFTPPFLGRRRGWALITQVAVAAGLVGMALTSPATGPAAVAIFALVVAFASASQDIVLDAYKTDVLHDRERGFGAAVFVTGYRLAMMVAGGVCAVLADELGWSAAYLAMAGLMGVGILATLAAPVPEYAPKPPRSLGAAVVEPLVELFSRKAAIWILLAVVLYKVGDAFAAGLFTAFLKKELQFSPTEIGIVRKSVGFFATTGGILVAGIVMTRLGLWRSLLAFGVFQAASNVIFMVLAEAGHDYALMVTSVAVENVTSGMGTAAFVAFLMALCDHRYTATQYALLSSLAYLGRVVIAPLSGPAVEAVGWTSFFGLSIVAALPGLALLVVLRRNIRALEHDPGSTAST
ncbi:MAG: MFS transporter [Deltaproteobacteria bacterium]|nr:MAG: MFS transporter [Deltaproteobacteria bacterium]